MMIFPLKIKALISLPNIIIPKFIVIFCTGYAILDVPLLVDIFTATIVDWI